jgi:serine/threonine protein kinase
MPFYDASTYSRNVLRPWGAFLWKLKSLEIILNQRGLAKSRNGSFGTIFQVRDTLRNKLFWIKCFTKDIKDRREHYVKIGNYLSKQWKQNFMEFEYIENWIEVFDDAWVKWKWPVLMMERVEWKSLSEHLENIIKDNAKDKASSKVSNLINKFLELFKILKDLWITHGDLQHGNIIIDKTENIVLIDYDGMYVPWSSTVAVEWWLPDYQHPERRNVSYIWPDTDEFSKIVIRYWLSLVEIDPMYWSSNYWFESWLLFNANDFAAPDTSKIFVDITAKQKSDTRYASLPSITLLKQICTSPYESIPALEDFMHWKIQISKDKVIYITIHDNEIETVVATKEGKKFKIPQWIHVWDEVARFRWEWNVCDDWSKWDLIYKIKTIQSSNLQSKNKKNTTSKQVNKSLIHGTDIYDTLSIYPEQLGNNIQYKNYLLQIPKNFQWWNSIVQYQWFWNKGNNWWKDWDLYITYKTLSQNKKSWTNWRVIIWVIVWLLFLIGIFTDSNDTTNKKSTIVSPNPVVKVVKDVQEVECIAPVNGVCDSWNIFCKDEYTIMWTGTSMRCKLTSEKFNCSEIHKANVKKIADRNQALKYASENCPAQ